MMTFSISTAPVNFSANYIIAGGQQVLNPLLSDQVIVYSNIMGGSATYAQSIVFSQRTDGLTPGTQYTVEVGIKATAGTFTPYCCGEYTACQPASFSDLSPTYTPSAASFSFMSAIGVRALFFNHAYTSITSGQVMDSFSVTYDGVYDCNELYCLLPSPARPLSFTIPPSGAIQFTVEITMAASNGFAYAFILRDNTTQAWAPPQLLCVDCTYSIQGYSLVYPTFSLTFEAYAPDLGYEHNATFAFFVNNPVQLEGDFSFQVSAV